MQDQFFTVPYSIGNGVAVIAGIPQPVEQAGFKLKTNSNPEGKQVDKFKELAVNALKAAKVPTEGLTDDQLLAEYSKLQVNADDDKGSDSDAPADIKSAIAEALKPLADQIKEIQKSAAATILKTNLALEKAEKLVKQCAQKRNQLKQKFGKNSEI